MNHREENNMDLCQVFFIFSVLIAFSMGRLPSGRRRQKQRFEVILEQKSQCSINSLISLDDVKESGVKATCPFVVQQRTKSHSSGEVSIEYTEIVCAGQCDTCTKAGGKEPGMCKQLKTRILLSAPKSSSAAPEEVIVRSGCICNHQNSKTFGNLIKTRQLLI